MLIYYYVFYLFYRSCEMRKKRTFKYVTALLYPEDYEIVLKMAEKDDRTPTEMLRRIVSERVKQELKNEN